MRHGAGDDADSEAELGYAPIGGAMNNGTWRVPNHDRRGSSMDPATRKLLLVAAAAGGVLMLGIGAWSLIGHRNAVVPVLQADSRPIRVKPENPGGLQVIGANDEIMSGDAGPAASRLGPAAEAPAPNVLRASRPETPPPRMASLSANPSAVVTDAEDADTAPPAATHPPVSALPEKKPVPTSSHPAAPAAKAGGTQVQFAALGSEDAARAEWAQLTKRLPDLLNGHQPAFSKTERDGKVYWRVRTGGFADMAQATSFCERVRAKGAACSIAAF